MGVAMHDKMTPDYWICDIHDEHGKGRFNCKACRDEKRLGEMLSRWLPIK